MIENIDMHEVEACSGGGLLSYLAAELLAAASDCLDSLAGPNA